MKMVPKPVFLWNISVWNAVTFEKIESEDLPNCLAYFDQWLMETSTIWTCTESLLKTEWFFILFRVTLMTALAETFTGLHVSFHIYVESHKVWTLSETILSAQPMMYRCRGMPSRKANVKGKWISNLGDQWGYLST